MVWLHGTLYCSILEARDLVDDTNLGHFVPSSLPGKLGKIDTNGKMGKMFGKMASKVEGSLAKALHTESPPDCYCVVSLNEARVAHTAVAPKSNHPQWGERFILLVAHDIQEVLITVKDKDVLGSKFMGKMSLPAAQVAEGRVIEGWFPLLDTYGEEPMKNAHHQVSSLYIRLQYQNVLQDPALQHDAPFRGVENTYFPARGGCRVTLYKDAHVGHVPEIPLAGGRLYQPACCWIDMYNAICSAKHFIYVTGWSVYSEFKLVRDPTKPNSDTPYPTFGELLKKKADEGVRVLLMVWDDRTSVDYGMVNTGGVMGTHDEETRRYFQNTDVTCVLFPREGTNEQSSLINRNATDRIFTHHQKTVIYDAPVAEGGQHGAGARQLMTFVGGLDVTNGRYDTGTHSLFRTLATEHSDDLHQPCIVGADAKFGGPREPWHDIHCRLEGPAAWDILTNFKQRWNKQGKNPNALLRMSDVPGLVVTVTQGRDDGNPAVMVLPPQSQEEFRAQVFRSIDSDSADGFPLSNAEAASLGLDSGKGRIIEHSIQKAYINAIRQAEHFIYIENQYFLGSSHCWAEDRHAGAVHLLPIEIALKAVQKINAGERFMAYIMVPLFPEGPPESAAVQEILHWQCNTVKMMYAMIAGAIRAKGINAHPTDYLQFFAPGNRESLLPGEVPPLEKAPAGGLQALAQETRRHMIYVHSKMMIVDDEYIIIGSANINQRSMDGGRDTEIAMGAFQPAYFANADGVLPRGDIHGFRMALWEEHTNIILPSFYQPSSLECVEDIRHIGRTNWDVFAGPEVKDMPGHLMLYPYAVDAAGGVTAVQDLIPDTKKARVCGSKSISLPCPLTT